MKTRIESTIYFAAFFLHQSAHTFDVILIICTVAIISCLKCFFFSFLLFFWFFRCCCSCSDSHCSIEKKYYGNYWISSFCQLHFVFVAINFKTNIFCNGFSFGLFFFIIVFFICSFGGFIWYFIVICVIWFENGEQKVNLISKWLDFWLWHSCTLIEWISFFVLYFFGQIVWLWAESRQRNMMLSLATMKKTFTWTKSVCSDSSQVNNS